jgi:triphosphoribosyl-dephospho-CoA synthase
VIVRSSLAPTLPPGSPRGRGRWQGAALDPAAVDRAALEALHEELAAFPKPGLVSLVDRGAHRDMDAGTFLDCLRALRGFFGEAARAGLEDAPLGALRALGVRAEARMLDATGGVNTHRGAIFALGLVAAAAGRAARCSGEPGPAALRAEVRALGAELRDALPEDRWSHGARAARRHGVPGARAEAVAGLPHVFDVALPALERSLARGAHPRAAAVEALLHLVAILPDTNLLHRGGAEGLAFARESAREFLRAGGVHRRDWEASARAMHRAFVARNLSPGGSADLLAAGLFVRRLSRRRPGAAP